MKTISASADVIIPESVTLEVKARKVRVKGPRGALKRNFGHIACEMYLVDEKTLRVSAWHANRKALACIRTVCSHIENLITGVTQGFRYKMRLVYAHFPINVSIVNANKCIEIRNFLGERVTRVVNMRGDVTIDRSANVKDELTLEGNDIDDVSQSAADIHVKTLVRDKDIRKFLDGVYVSEKGPIPAEDE